ncbi:MAG TPA: nuclease-related domain-containing protein [Kiritimatiellia bacterium]|nr:nuclease-related domain-containing protein [Kiritimatiellia bacterium]HRZ11266.1 nuclease-related domain-containing protein [Kiritimatiellia bacterium]HSA19117.1 nuclease-related domain-containing protein [Kiritimatiellia bacterium]
MLRWVRWLELAGALVLLAGGIGLWVWRDIHWLALVGAGLLFAWLGHHFKMQENSLDAWTIGVGLEGEQGVTDRLATGLDDRYLVLNDVFIQFGRRRAQIDHVVAGPNGIFVIETKNWAGRIVGDETQNHWVFYAAGKDGQELFNPILQSQRQAKFVARRLREAGMDWPDMRALVVMFSEDSRWAIRNQTAPILRPAELAPFIRNAASGRSYRPEEIDAAGRWIMQDSG